MAEFWDLIVRSNTFNFAVLLVILGILYHKLNISSAIEKMKAEVIAFIENSKNEREQAEKHLTDTKKSVENLDNEIKDSLEKSRILAQNVFDEIQSMAQKSVEKIEANVDKIIDNERRKTTTRLSKSTAQKAIEVATAKLKEKFEQNPELHKNYINQSIEILDRIKL